MKRHKALIPLSRFHRSCLFLALVAKENAPDVKGYPTDIAGKIDYAISFYNGPLKSHFGLEQQLWQFVSDKSVRLKEITEDLLAERRELHRIFKGLCEKPSVDSLNQMGTLLEIHVRKEERVLFQQIQMDLTEAELSQISSLID